MAVVTSESLPVRAAQAYLYLLQTTPVATKSVTSAIIGALADMAAQTVLKTREYNVSSAANYAVLGLVVTGPVTHYFYKLLDAVLPTTLPASGILRLAADRLLFGPIFLFITLYLLNRLEGRSHVDTLMMLQHGFMPMFKANLRFWVPLQYINVNYVPQLYRVLFANICAFFWIIIMASKRRRAALRAAEKRDQEDSF